MKGRPRLKNVMRSKSGKSRGPIEMIHPETMAVRERQLEADGVILSFSKIEAGREIIKRTAEDRLSGFTLGRLLLRHQQDKSNPGGISEAQFEAGEAWKRLVHQHAALLGYKLTAKSPSFLMVGGFGMPGPDKEDHEISRIRNQWVRCYNALVERCRAEKTNKWRLINILYSVVIEDRPVNQISREEMGYLRDALNELSRVLR